MAKEKFTQKEVSRAFRDFSDFAGDVEQAEWAAWSENLRLFLHFCENNPVMETVLAPLKNTTLIDYDSWRSKLDTEKSDEKFPSDEDERTALYYQILLAANKHPNKYSFLINIMMTIYSQTGGKNAADSISSFNNEIFFKFARTMRYRLEEIQDEIANQNEVGRESLIAFHFTNHGTLITGNVNANHSQVAIGESDLTRIEV